MSVRTDGITATVASRLRPGLYRRAFLLAWSEANAYRADALFTAFFFWVPVALSLLIWQAVLRAGGSPAVGGYTLPQLVTYFALTALVGRGGGEDRRIAREIMDGGVKRYLVQPVDFGALRLTLAAARRCAGLLQVAPGVVLLALLLRGHLVAPALPAGGLFAVSLALGIVLDFQILLLLGMTAFWVGETAVFGIAGWVLSLCNGTLFPLDLLPAWAATAAHWLPFPYTVFYPAGIFIGRIPAAEAERVLLLQVAWVVLLVVATRLVWRRGVARYEAYGG